MKWQGPGGSAGELAEMFKQDWMKLRPLACEVSSLPHHPPRRVFTIVTSWICFGGAVTCEVLLRGGGAQAEDRRRPAVCAPSAHSSSQPRHGRGQRGHAGLPCLPLLSPTGSPWGFGRICVVILFIVLVFSRQRIWNQSGLFPTAAAVVSEDLLGSVQLLMFLT